MNISEVNRFMHRRVRILECGHSDVKAGTVGVVVDIKDEGWAVEVEGAFLIAGANATREHRKEVVWVAKDKVELYEP